jgi:hypothetical protein
VYQHTFPDGRVYIGITSGDPAIRWNNGMGYEKQRKVFSEIVAFGWNNIRHDVLLCNLTEEDAKTKEQELIRCAGQKAINVQYKQHPTMWIDEPINNETIKENSFRFRLLDDYWLEHYKKINGNYPFASEIHVGHICFVDLKLINGRVQTKKFKVDYPNDIETFRDLHSWLMSGEWVQGQHEPILKEGVK